MLAFYFNFDIIYDEVIKLAMSDRVKEIRTAKGLNQTEFAKLLGIGQSTLAMMEVSKRNISARHIKTICSILNINESWLRTGVGEMFNKPKALSLDQYAIDHHLTPLELDIVREYMSMDEDTRKVIMDKIMAVAKRHMEAETAAALADNGIDIDAEVENYRRELEAKRASQTLKVLPNSDIAG